jgi:hypothetical protein
MRIEARAFRWFPPTTVVYTKMAITELGKRDM